MEECKICLNNNTIRGITITNGKCNICDSYYKIKDMTERYDLLDIIFCNTIDKYKNQKKYDAVIGLSGGKDSTYVLLQLIRKYKLKVKAITFDNGFLTEVAKENIKKTVVSLNVNHEFISFDHEYLKETYNQSIKLTGTPCLGCSFIMYAAIHNYAKKNDIPMIFHGRSRAQMLGKFDMSDKAPFQKMYVNNPYYANLTNRVFPYYNTNANTNIPYIGYFIYYPYDKNTIKKELSEAIGWIDVENNGKSVEHFDCAAHPAAMYLHYKFNGYPQNLDEINQEIRDKKISKSEAIKIINKNNNMDLDVQSLSSIANVLEIDNEELLVHHK